MLARVCYTEAWPVTRMADVESQSVFEIALDLVPSSKKIGSKTEPKTA
jgi:hypothetical protein